MTKLSKKKIKQASDEVINASTESVSALLKVTGRDSAVDKDIREQRNVQN